MICKVCLDECFNIFRTKVLGKYDVDYYQCQSCKFIQTEEPYWIPEAYTNAITTLDLGLLSRNNSLLPVAQTLITKFFEAKAKFIDYAGGYGVFVRLMRDAGYDFHRQDLYCDNIFAKGFDIKDDTDYRGKYELLTAFEVFEHLDNPLIEVEKMLDHSDNIFFSTELQPHADVRPDNWWYFTPETGQHISLYTLASLRAMASKFKLQFYSNGVNLHLFTKKKISAAFFRTLVKYRIARIYSTLWGRRKSLLNSDFNTIRDKIRNKL
jgi:hypothetical protein